MNAIAGLIQQPLSANARDIVGKMCGIQRHRNPAGEEIVSLENACFGIGNPSSSDERKNPQSRASSTFLLSCDSTICNGDELRKSLAQHGLPCGTESDEELILKLYERYRQKCPVYLRGDFAFAIWDAPRQTLFLARDRFGLRPLFYCRAEGALLFASELKALIKTGMVDRDLDTEAIYHYLFFTFFRQPQTPFRQVKSLLPAHTLTFNVLENTIHSDPYWDIPYSSDKKMDEEFLVREGLSVLKESVALRAQKASGIGLSLSGGLDSSVIAALLAECGYPFKTFTFGFRNEGRELSEFHFASLVAEKTGSKHTEVVMTSENLRNSLPHMAWHFDTPSAGIMLPYFLAKAAGQADVDITFRGDGAHSIFESPVERRFLTLHRIFSDLNPLPAPIKQRLFNAFERLFTSLEPGVRNRPGTFAAAVRLIGSYFQTVTGRKSLDLMFSETERKRLFSSPFVNGNSDFHNTHDLILDVMRQSPSQHILEQLIYEEFHRFSDQALPHISSVNAAFSLTGVQPYLDHKVVEFSQNYLPLSLRTMTMPNKYVLHKIAEPFVPDQVLNRTQHGFAMPFHVWLKTDLKPVVDVVFSRQSINRRGLFRYEAMKQLYDAYYGEHTSYISWRRIWAFVILEIWLRLYLDPREIEAPSGSISTIMLSS